MFLKGDLIAMSYPYAFALCSDQRLKRCDHCFKVLKNKITCHRCSYVSYCSLQCQRESSSSQIHNHECQILAKRPLSNMSRLMARVICRIEREGPYEAEEIGSYKRDWHCLMDHYDNVLHDSSAMHVFNAVFENLELIFGDRLPAIELLISIYGKILVNSFAVQDEMMEQIGRAIYLDVSIMDHSCQPSASFMFIGTAVCIKAITDIPSDDIKDLRISYIDELESDSERRRQLETQYYFTCDCERCSTCQNLTVIDMSEDDTLRPICDKLEKFLSLDERRKREKEHEKENQECMMFAPNDYRFHFLKCSNSNSHLSLESKRESRKGSEKEEAEEKEHEKHEFENDNPVGKLVSQLRCHQQVMSLRSVIDVRIADMIAIYDKDIDLSLKIIEIFRNFYGKWHPRLALRLFVTALMCDVSQHRFPNLKQRLLNEAKSIAQFLTPSEAQVRSYCIKNSARNQDQISRINQIVEQQYITKSKATIENSQQFSTLLNAIESEELKAEKQLYCIRGFMTLKGTTKTQTREKKNRSKSAVRDYGRSGRFR